MNLYSTELSTELAFAQCLPQCSISISKGLSRKKCPSPHYAKSSPFQHKYYVPCSNGIVENYIKNPLVL